MHSAFYRLWHSSAGASAVFFHRSPRAKIYFITCSYLPRLKHRARANTRTHSQASGLMQANALGGSKAPLTLNEFAKGIRVSVWVCVCFLGLLLCFFFFSPRARRGAEWKCCRVRGAKTTGLDGLSHDGIPKQTAARLILFAGLKMTFVNVFYFNYFLFYFIFCGLLCQTYVFCEWCNNTKHPPVYHKIRWAPKHARRK